MIKKRPTEARLPPVDPESLTESQRAIAGDDVQLIELLALIGFYRMNAGMLNSMGVQPEPWSLRLGEVPAALSGH